MTRTKQEYLELAIKELGTHDDAMPDSKLGMCRSLRILERAEVLELTDALQTAYHCLKSYEYGNSSTEIAAGTANFMEGFLKP